jgi:hypothetical protein
MYSQQHIRLYETVKFHHKIFILVHFTTKHRFDWKYLTVSINLSCCCPFFGLCDSLKLIKQKLMRLIKFMRLLSSTVSRHTTAIMFITFSYLKIYAIYSKSTRRPGMRTRGRKRKDTLRYLPRKQSETR